MASAVERAIYALGADTAQYRQAMESAAKAGEQLAVANDKIETSTERVTKATRTTADSLSKVEARYDNVLKLEQRRAAELEKVNRILEDGNASQARAAEVAGKVVKFYDDQIAKLKALAQANQDVAKTQAMVNAAANVNSRLGVRDDFNTGARKADIVAYAAELDRLRAKFNPLFAAGREYRGTLEEIGRAQKVGAISAVEAAAAIGRTKDAFAAQVLAIRGVKVGADAAAAANDNLRAVQDDLLRSAEGLGGRLGIVGGALARLGPAGIAAAAGLALLGTTFVGGVKGAIESEAATKRLNAILQVTGNTTGQTAAEIDQFAEALEASGKTTAEQVKQAAGVLATFGVVSGQAFNDTIAAAQRMAQVMGGDVVDKTQFLASTFGNLEGAAERLRKQGVILTQAQRDQIEAFGLLGERGKAVEVILAAINKRYGELDPNATTSIAGSFDKLSTSLGNLAKAAAEATGVPAFLGLLAEAANRSARGIEQSFKPETLERQIVKATETVLELENRIAEQRQKVARAGNPLQQNVQRELLSGLESELQRAQSRVDALIAQSRKAADEKRDTTQAAATEQDRQRNEVLEKRARTFDGILNQQREELRLAGMMVEREREIAQARSKAMADVVGAAGFKDPLAKFGTPEALIASGTLPPDVIKAAQQAADIAQQRLETERRIKSVLDGQAKSFELAAEKAAEMDKDRREAFERSRELFKERDEYLAKSGQEVELNKKRIDALQESRVEYDALTNSYRRVSRELDVVNEAARIKADKGATLLSADEIRRMAEANVDLAQSYQKVDQQQQRQIEQLNRQADLAVEPFKNAASGIQGAFADAFEGIFDGSTNLTESLKRVFTRFAAEIAALLIFRPVVGGVLNSLGLGGLAQQMGLGGIGVGAFGQGALGSAGTVVSPNFIGPLQAGQSYGSGGFDLSTMLGLTGQSGFLGGGLQTILGGAGIGLAAPQLLRSLGLGVGKGSPVGSGIGGIGGAVLGNMLLPGIGGILGGVAGGFLGDIFGGLFGGGGKDEDDIAREQYLQQRAQTLAGLNTQLDAFIARGNTGAQSGIGQQIKAISDEGQALKQQFYDLNDVSRMGEITAAVNAQIKKLTDEFIKGVTDQTLAITDAGGRVRRDLDKTAEELRKSAAEAGTGFAEVEALIAAQLGEARRRQDTEIAVALGGLTGNPTAAFDELVRQQAERLATVKSLGGNIVAAEALAAAERIELFKGMSEAQKALLEPLLSAYDKALLGMATAGETGAEKLNAAALAMKNLGENIDDFLRGLDLSDLSTKAAGGKYAEARRQLEETAAAARLGDADAAGRVQQELQTFLTLSRGVFGGGDQYQQDYQFARQLGIGLGEDAPGISTALGKAGLDLQSVLTTGLGAISDNSLTAAEATPILATIDELGQRLAGLVDPSHAAVKELDDLRAKLIVTRDATEEAIANQPIPIPNTNPTPLPGNDNGQSALPGWQQGAMAGGPSAEFRDALLRQLYPDATYGSAPQEGRQAVDSLFQGDARGYLMMGGNNAAYTLMNTGLYSAQELTEKYGVQGLTGFTSGGMPATGNATGVITGIDRGQSTLGRAGGVIVGGGDREWATGSGAEGAANGGMGGGSTAGGTMTGTTPSIQDFIDNMTGQLGAVGVGLAAGTPGQSIGAALSALGMTAAIGATTGQTGLADLISSVIDAVAGIPSTIVDIQANTVSTIGTELGKQLSDTINNHGIGPVAAAIMGEMASQIGAISQSMNMQDFQSMYSEPAPSVQAMQQMRSNVAMTQQAIEALADKLNDPNISKEMQVQAMMALLALVKGQDAVNRGPPGMAVNGGNPGTGAGQGLGGNTGPGGVGGSQGQENGQGGYATGGWVDVDKYALVHRREHVTNAMSANRPGIPALLNAINDDQPLDRFFRPVVSMAGGGDGWRQVTAAVLQVESRVVELTATLRDEMRALRRERAASSEAAAQQRDRHHAEKKQARINPGRAAAGSGVVRG